MITPHNNNRSERSASEERARMAGGERGIRGEGKKAKGDGVLVPYKKGYPGWLHKLHPDVT